MNFEKSWTPYPIMPTTFLKEHPDLTYEASDQGYLMSLWVAEPLVYLHGERPLGWIPEYLFGLTDPIVASQYLPENS